LLVRRNPKALVVYPYLLTLILSVLMVSVAFSITSAQVASPTPSVTPTAMPPQSTLTPTPSVVYDAALSIFMNKRLPINVSHAADIQEFFHWKAHFADVTSLVFLPSDGLVSTSSDGNGSLKFPSIRLWQIQNDSLTLVGSAFEDILGAIPIASIQASQDGRLLAAGYGGSVTIWDGATGGRITTVPQTWAQTTALRGYEMVAGGENGVVGQWLLTMPSTDYVETGTFPPNFSFMPNQAQLITAFQMDEAVVQVAIEPLTDQIFILTKSGKLSTYSNPDGVIGTLRAIPHETQSDVIEPVHSNGILMALRANEHHIIYAGSHQDVVVYDYDQNQEIATYPLGADVICVTFNDQDNLLVIGDTSVPGLLHILDMESYTLITQINTHQIIHSCAFNEDGKLLATGDSNGTIHLWGIN
jgi:WD40 repeat protein